MYILINFVPEPRYPAGLKSYQGMAFQSSLQFPEFIGLDFRGHRFVTLKWLVAH